MSHALSFTQRFDKLIGAAVQRTGYLGRPAYYGGIDFNDDAYKKFGIAKKPFRYASDFVVPSLDDARCPSCHAACEVVGVRDTSHMSFDGTFADDSKRNVAQGTLQCSKNAAHTVKLGYGFCDVFVDSTVAELVVLLDDIAAEMGY